MTQEEKELLLKDLCCRLSSYELIVQYKQKTFNPYSEYTVDVKIEFDSMLHHRLKDLDFKPYLRSLSSMTEEEKKELSKKYVWNIWSGQIQIRYHSQGCWDDETECPTEEYIILFDWLNAHHFDYRGLIKKGLALEALKDMYKYNN
jgi:hypothetical protein